MLRRVELRRPRLMLALVAAGLVVSGVTVWPLEWELEIAAGLFRSEFLARALAEYRAAPRLLLYGFDWLAYAHLVLAALFAMAIPDPVRNVLVFRFGLLCCATVPLLAAIFIPLRGLPGWWFWVDLSFAPACALPLWIGLRDVTRLEKA